MDALLATISPPNNLYQTWKRRLEPFFPQAQGFVIHVERDVTTYNIPLEIISITRWHSDSSFALISGEATGDIPDYRRCMEANLGTPHGYSSMHWGAILKAVHVMFYCNMNPGSQLECTGLFHGELDFESPTPDAERTLRMIKGTFATWKALDGIDMNAYSIIGPAAPITSNYEARVASGAGTSSGENDSDERSGDVGYVSSAEEQLIPRIQEVSTSDSGTGSSTDEVRNEGERSNQ
ncbi:uncharacterized protein BO80DRAFT_449994 [Aspergillus ibericus CBS 121593]|uniref:Uncharacterized protein n=1 Tax=Aspergillus ibericus CBS 121593 TaxID=1448316 RepID=A0A395GJL7_9EURO|nr:hypothetical protein BO80DRAFT_449994 [Aspergillus ibericus CBS 121593]RAK95681.1 hypothetical protein BO80DRAFT_449994 [Aspergillus ibericus CBS 121593]